MSLGGDGVGAPAEPAAALRALAHPVRLQMLSLLTGAQLTTTEIARELGITHANASYHLRLLLAAGQIEVAGEEHIRGGVAKRYRYRMERTEQALPEGPEKDEAMQMTYAALAVELQRRAAFRAPGPGALTDAELWVDAEVWEAVREQVNAASDQLHRAARPPRTAGTVRVNASIALFRMEPDR